MRPRLGDFNRLDCTALLAVMKPSEKENHSSIRDVHTFKTMQFDVLEFFKQPLEWRGKEIHVRFGLRSFLVVLAGIAVIIGVFVFRWEREKLIIRNINALDEVGAKAGSLEAELKQMILDDPNFVWNKVNSEIPPTSKISGGHSNTSFTLNLPPNRTRQFKIHYLFYWPTVEGLPSDDNRLDVWIGSDFVEKSKTEPQFRIIHGSSELSQRAAEWVKRTIDHPGVEVLVSAQ